MKEKLKLRLEYNENGNRLETLECPEKSDTRDTEAIKRITTAYMKLLFPNVRTVKDISKNEFNRYCLRPATRMRKIIKTQLGIMDIEYRGKDVPKLIIRGFDNE